MTDRATTIMPWGQYRGRAIDTLPPAYCRWLLGHLECDEDRLVFDALCRRAGLEPDAVWTRGKMARAYERLRTEHVELKARYTDLKSQLARMAS